MACIKGKEAASKLCAYGTCRGAMEGKRDGQNEKEVREAKREDYVMGRQEKEKKAKRKLHRTERGVEKAKLKAKQRFIDNNERIEIIAASARTHAYESQMKEELKVKEKANLMRTTGKNQCTCL
ncbi:hypothetical protein Rs2_04292 [Raphanus sativus]|nr:hypothetical protein Rs2_04292 [Raphanus sativus]